MQAYVINLPGDHDRLAHMTEVLGREGIPFRRFDALDAARAREHPCFGLIPNMRVRPWLPGELGCLLSHYEVWRMIAAGPDAYGLVFEDDVFVDSRIRSIVSGAIPLPRGADLVKLEIGTQDMMVLSRRSRSRSGGVAFHRLLSEHYGSGGYALSRRGASFLLASASLFDMPVDCLLFGPDHPIGSKLRAYQAVPALVIQSVNLHFTTARPSPKAQGTHTPQSQLASHLETDRRAMGHIALVLQAYRARTRPGTGSTRWRRRARRLWLRLTTRRVKVTYG